MWKQFVSVMAIGTVAAGGGLAACSRPAATAESTAPVIEVSQEELEAVTSMTFPPSKPEAPLAVPLLIDPAATPWSPETAPVLPEAL